MINLINLTSNLQLDAVDGLLLKKVKLEIKNIFLCAHLKYFVREMGALVTPWLRLVHCPQISSCISVIGGRQGYRVTMLINALQLIFGTLFNVKQGWSCLEFLHLHYSILGSLMILISIIIKFSWQLFQLTNLLQQREVAGRAQLPAYSFDPIIGKLFIGSIKNGRHTFCRVIVDRSGWQQVSQLLSVKVLWNANNTHEG